MSERKRFTELKNGRYVQYRVTGCYNDCDCKGDYTTGASVDRLAELEDKIEQGTLIELPCKVGAIIYYVGSYQIGTWKKKIRYDIFEFPFTLDMLDTYGNNWFLTREEAEKRLKELQNG